MIGNIHYNMINEYATKEKKNMTLESIMSKLGKCEEINLMNGAHESLMQIKNDVFYVQPMYEEIHFNSDAKFVLFSAPGASGKSTLAKHIAKKNNGLYWNLAKITLGENSFHGTLWRAMRQEELLKYFNNIKTGKACLVLDAFDEAEMISGRVGIEYLLKDLNEATSDSKFPTVFLFARTESATFISDYCNENKINYSRYEIGFFQEYNAKDFIKQKLEMRGRSITQTVIDCIDEQFVVIKRLLGDEELSKSFIGYAPVLEALSESFDEERNTVKLLKEIKESNVSSTNIIFKILEYLLKREHDKVCDGLKEKWRSKYPNFEKWDNIYTIKEQLIRVVEYIIMGNVEEESFYEHTDMPEELYVDYLETLRIFLPQHPFLQNLISVC